MTHLPSEPYEDNIVRDSVDEIYAQEDHDQKLDGSSDLEDKNNTYMLPTVGQTYGEQKFDEEPSYDPAVRIAQWDLERAERVAQRRQGTNCFSRVIQRVIPYGSIPASAFNLASSTIGAGIISLPSAWRFSGVSMAVVYMVVLYLLTVYSFYCLGKAGVATGVRSYPKNMEILLGRPAGYLLAVILFIASFGAETSYVISLHDIMAAFLKDAKNTPEYLRSTSGTRLITAMIWLCTMMPLCIPKEINSLRYFSTAAVSIIVYFVIAMIIHSCQNGIKDGTYKQMVPFATGTNAIRGVSIFIFAFGCQLNAYEVFGELHQPTVRRLTITSAVASGCCFVLYLLAGLFGYMDFGASITGSALKRYNPVKSPMMGVAYAGLMLKLAVGYGLHSIPVRECTYHVFGLQCRTLAYWKHTLIVVFLATCSLVLGLFIPNVNLVFGVTGGLCGGFDNYIFPALMYMYSGGFSFTKVGWFRYFTTYFLMIVGVIGVVWGPSSTIFCNAVKC